MTGKVILEGLEFHAYHGVYPQERSSGNKFEVDVSVETEIDSTAFADDLTGTINYENLYDVVKKEMARPSKLLERVGHSIAEQILATFPQALSVQITFPSLIRRSGACSTRVMSRAYATSWGWKFTKRAWRRGGASRGAWAGRARTRSTPAAPSRPATSPPWASPGTRRCA